jgi:tRNA pseudouridine38-40 synthase
MGSWRLVRSILDVLGYCCLLNSQNTHGFSFPPRCGGLGGNVHVTHSVPSNNCEEKEEARQLRLFWQGRPFAVAERIVHRVLTRTDSAPERLLQAIIPQSGTIKVEEPFASFYNGKHAVMTCTSNAVPSRDRIKQSFRLDLAYAGQYFCGWQRQLSNLDLPSVQETIENALASADFWCPNGPSPDVRVSGRTDAGVHAVGQVARIRVLPSANNVSIVSCYTVKAALDEAAAASNFTWKCVSVQAVSDNFHPTFCSKARSYVYLIDVDALHSFFSPNNANLVASTTSCAWTQKIVHRMNLLLAVLVGKELDYLAFSYGKVKTQTTLCCLQTAQARLMEEVLEPSSRQVLAVELTGDRFLRRMVRILVATALQAAIADDSWNSNHLLDICISMDRQRTAHPAQPGGLIFVGASFGAGCSAGRFPS